jgi:hypothetical protein
MTVQGTTEVNGCVEAESGVTCKVERLCRVMAPVLYRYLGVDSAGVVGCSSTCMIDWLELWAAAV